MAELVFVAVFGTHVCRKVNRAPEILEKNIIVFARRRVT